MFNMTGIFKQTYSPRPSEHAQKYISKDNGLFQIKKDSCQYRRPGEDQSQFQNNIIKNTHPRHDKLAAIIYQENPILSNSPILFFLHPDRSVAEEFTLSAVEWEWVWRTKLCVYTFIKKPCAIHNCHPDRGAAEWRDLFKIIAILNVVKIINPNNQ
jgi:hypothetical protein